MSEKPMSMSEPRTHETGGRFKSLLTDFEGVFTSILKIERSEDIPPDHGSALRWRSSLKDQLKDAVDQLKSDPDQPLSVFGGFEGREGMNRYELMSDGTVRLSAMHAIGDSVMQAKKLGIVVDNLYDKEARNGPCPCGSGKSFRVCHGRG